MPARRGGAGGGGGTGGGGAVYVPPAPPSPIIPPIPSPTLYTIQLPVLLGGGSLSIDKFRAAELLFTGIGLYILGQASRRLK